MKKNFNRGQYGTKTISRRKKNRPSYIDDKIAEVIKKVMQNESK